MSATIAPDRAGPIAEAVAAGELPGRVWLYSNYHCNLACSYCLTESSPRSERRQLTSETMLAVAEQAGALGFTGLGVTGGEPMLLA
ncbi:MAG: 4Fe-4S cluster-binding domain-containing protein, partial [Acidimicrobiia bacterium]|nr:4Fe-4S cluster-binding domain-containing protein [Acidimicrobiia bacterium]